MKWKEIPDCCKKCVNFESDFNEFNNLSSFYCTKNIIFPTKKQSCKKTKQMKDGE